MFQLRNGDIAPAINLADSHGDLWNLSDHLGKMVILHFGRGVY